MITQKQFDSILELLEKIQTICPEVDTSSINMWLTMNKCEDICCRLNDSGITNYEELMKTVNYNLGFMNLSFSFVDRTLRLDTFFHRGLRTLYCVLLYHIILYNSV